LPYFIQYHSPLCITTQRLTAINRMLPITRYAANRKRDKSYDQTHLFSISTIEAMDRTSGQTPGQAELIGPLANKEEILGLEKRKINNFLTITCVTIRVFENTYSALRGVQCTYS
jgi:hypothetical protein